MATQDPEQIVVDPAQIVADPEQIVADPEQIIADPATVKEKPAEEAAKDSAEKEEQKDLQEILKEARAKRPKKKEGRPPSSMESICLLRMAQRISWKQVEKMADWYPIDEEDMKELDSAISLILVLKHKRMLRTDRLRKALKHAGNDTVEFYLDLLDEYKQKEDIQRKTAFAKKATGKLVFFLKKELTMADVCKLSVFLYSKPKRSLDFVDVMQSLAGESKISRRKQQFSIMLIKIGRIELANRFVKMDWSFLELLGDEWFKYGVTCVLDDLKARDNPDYWTMERAEIEAKKGKPLEGEYGMPYNLM